MLSTLLQKGIKRLHIFESFNEDIVDRYWQLADSDSLLFDAERVPNHGVAAILSQIGTNLEHLTASFLVDAHDFFRASLQGQTWKELKTLAMTSRILMPDGDSTKREELMLAAAAAAGKMPKLQVMEIWRGDRNDACVFRYDTTGPNATVSWHGTWLMELGSELVAAWQPVAVEHSGRRLCVERSEKIRGSLIKSHSDAIEKLKLKVQVIHPVSLRQAQRELATGFYN
ncbi:hypothetical protein QQX98_011111 [Neonectria punicea]|uniref:DUF6546 domain-containing protein n=1 Tax=Neonectria punicea TaxID=979145 RepID=A0ABR1GMI3_9HYPO